MTRLVTARLLLRDFTWSDQAAVHAFAGDPVVTRFMDWGPNDVHDTRAFLTMAVAQTSHRRRTEFEFAIVPTEPEPMIELDAARERGTARARGTAGERGTAVEPGMPIGSISLRITDQQHRQGELGYVLARAFWSRGYATEAARALLTFGFGELELHRIAATCHPENLASARVLEKAGMELEGRLRDHKLVHGVWRDSLLYAAVSRSD